MANSVNVAKLVSSRVPMLAGTLAVSLIFALSRWGSYIHIESVYITDVLLALAMIHWSLGRIGSRGVAGQVRKPAGITFLVLAVSYAIARLFLGREYDLVALRDAVPYFYAAIGVLSALSYRSASSRGQAKTAQFLRAALTVHIGWAFAAILMKGTLIGPALSPNTYVFQIRSDIDAGLAGILTGLALASALASPKGRLWNLVLAAASTFVILSVPNRSGILSLCAVLLAVLVAYMSAKNAGVGRLLLVGSLPVVLAGILTWLPTTTPGARLLATFGLANNQVELGAQGTTAARIEAWRILLAYWVEDPSRFMFGVGFGPDFLVATGTNVLLGSETFEGVRSPHNYLIGTAMRLGLVGVAITVLVLVLVLRAVWRIRSRLSDDKLLLTCALTICALTPAAMVGVVYEAPFGAVPFFWASGILLAAARAASGATDTHVSRSATASIQAPTRVGTLKA